METVSLIIPTLNEEEGIEEVLHKLPVDELLEMGYELEVLVIDGGSKDDTVAIAKKNGAHVIYEEGGKASAVRRGIKESSGEIIFTIDGDATYSPSDIIRMLPALRNGNAMVVGSRFNGKISRGAMSKTNNLGNQILTTLANGLYGVKVSDLCTGLRGFTKSSLYGEMPPGKGFEIEASLHAMLAKKGLVEIPIDYCERKGESKLRTMDGIYIAIRLLKGKIKNKK